MATFTITGFPDDLYEQLQRRAAVARRSISEEVIHLLAVALDLRSPRHSILELKGLGRELWQGLDASRHIDEERRWDDS